MLNLFRAIPKIDFPTQKIIVGNPSTEPLVCLNDYFDVDSKYNHWVEQGGQPLPGSSPYVYARESVLHMLNSAERLLPDNYCFRIYDAYRPIAVQQALWDYFRAQIVAQNPHKTSEEIDALTSFCVSFPSYNVMQPSLHNTGGAVDLTIVDKTTGTELDMGTDFDEFTNKAWTNYFEETCVGDYEEVVCRNRRILYNVMTAVGFTNLPSEWWHYDFGDVKWAQLNNTTPIYAGILDARIPASVPYGNMEAVRALDEKQQSAVRIVHDQQVLFEDLSAQFVASLQRPIDDTLALASERSRSVEKTPGNSFSEIDSVVL